MGDRMLRGNDGDENLDFSIYTRSFEDPHSFILSQIEYCKSTLTEELGKEIEIKEISYIPMYSRSIISVHVTLDKNNDLRKRSESIFLTVRQRSRNLFVLSSEILFANLYKSES